MSYFRNLSKTEQMNLLRAQPQAQEALNIIASLTEVGYPPSILAFLKQKKDMYLSTDASVHDALLRDPYVDAVLRSNTPLYKNLVQQAQAASHRFLQYKGDNRSMHTHEKTFHFVCAQVISEQRFRSSQKSLKELHQSIHFISKTSSTCRAEFSSALAIVSSKNFLEKQARRLWQDEKHTWTGAEVFFVLSATISQGSLQKHLETKMKKGYPVGAIVRINQLMGALYYVVTAGEDTLRAFEEDNYQHGHGYDAWHSFTAMGRAMFSRISALLAVATGANHLLDGDAPLERLVEAYTDVMRLCYDSLCDLLCDMVEYYIHPMLIYLRLHVQQCQEAQM